MHWPVAFGHQRGSKKIEKTPRDDEGKVIIDERLTDNFMTTYHDMEKLQRAGLVRNIGVSNFDQPKLGGWTRYGVENVTETAAERLLGEANIRPACNQVELHLGHPQHDLLAYARDNDLLLQAYSPLGSTGARYRSNEVVTRIATRLHVDPANVLISWQVARGVCCLPKSVTASRISSNLVRAELTEADVDDLDAESRRLPGERVVNPSDDWGVTIWERE